MMTVYVITYTNKQMPQQTVPTITVTYTMRDHLMYNICTQKLLMAQTSTAVHVVY